LPRHLDSFVQLAREFDGGHPPREAGAQARILIINILPRSPVVALGMATVPLKVVSKPLIGEPSGRKGNWPI
jgi:hypothetical protein